MERFMLFRGERFYAKGGMYDFGGSYSSQLKAVEAGEKFAAKGPHWYHVYDTEEHVVKFENSVCAFQVGE